MAVRLTFVGSRPLSPQSLPPHERYSLAGPANYLLDHPLLVGILQEIVSGENHNLDADSAGTISVIPDRSHRFFPSSSSSSLAPTALCFRARASRPT